MPSTSTAPALVFIDAAVNDYQVLLRGIAPETEVIVLDATQDGVAQITQTLADRHNLRNLHIVSHGNSGELQLGTTGLNSKTLPQYAQQLRQWAAAIAPQADLLLYGCNVAAGELGNRFIHHLSRLTQTTIAASATLTGSAALGGDWNLSVTTGSVTTPIAFAPKAIAAYGSVLQTVLVSETFADSTVDTFGTWTVGGNFTPVLTARSDTTASQGIPGIGSGADALNDGALRLTDNQNDRQAFVFYNIAIPANAGLDIVFDFFAYNKLSTTPSGADGISFFLIDGSVNPITAGAFGGSLGYAQKDANAAPPTGQAGLVGGYLGIGLDEFGNFSANTEGRQGGAAPGPTPDAIAIRGSQATGYQYIVGTDSLGDLDEPLTTDRDDAARRVRIQLSREGSLTVDLDQNLDGIFAANERIIDTVNITLENGVQPETFKFGFAASTGGSTNIHEIRSITISTLTDPPTVTDASATFNPNQTRRLTGLSAIDPDSVSPGDADGLIDLVIIGNIPPAEQGTLFVGDPAQGGQPITNFSTTLPSGFTPPNGFNGPYFGISQEQLSQIFFQSSSGFTGSGFSYTAIDNIGAVPNVPAIVTLLPTDEAGGGVEPTPGCEDGLNLRGTARNNVIQGSEDSDTIRGLAGNDRLYGLNCDDRLDGGVGNDRLLGADDRDVLSGGSGRDTLNGGDDEDRLLGGSGNDLMNGAAGDDFLKGNVGRDRLLGGAGDDTLRGNLGNDSLRGAGGGDTLAGEGGRDRLVGGAGDDALDGGKGVDRLFGSSGDDVLVGGSGDDFIYGQQGNDRARGGLGRDRLVGGQGDDVLIGNRGNDNLRGQAAQDTLLGHGGVDILIGGDGNDSLDGGRGADRLNGGDGRDALNGGLNGDFITGGLGADRFIYTQVNEGQDVIVDFQIRRDLLDLQQLFDKPGFTRRNPVDRYLQFVQQGAATAVQIDANGDALGTSLRTLVLLEGVTSTSLSAANFIV